MQQQLKTFLYNLAFDPFNQAFISP